MKLMVIVILHYLSVELTKQCVESIKKNFAYSYYRIVIIDNGSHNKSGQELKDFYQDDRDITIILSRENLGFSAGNNIGYRYAKEILHADFIIVINNDTQMIQKDFLDKIEASYEKHKFFVMGPDVVNMNGDHQSPKRNHHITKWRARIWLIRNWVAFYYLRVHEFLKLPDKIFSCKKYLQSKIKKFYGASNQKNMMREGTDLELHGSCLVFSPLFIKENDYAFEELTFMYCEEQLLAIRCKKNGWKMLYNSELVILHMDGISTKEAYNGSLRKKIFCSQQFIRSIATLLKYMKEM